MTTPVDSFQRIRTDGTALKHFAHDDASTNAFYTSRVLLKFVSKEFWIMAILHTGLIGIFSEGAFIKAVLKFKLIPFSNIA